MAWVYLVSAEDKYYGQRVLINLDNVTHITRELPQTQMNSYIHFTDGTVRHVAQSIDRLFDMIGETQIRTQR